MRELFTIPEQQLEALKTIKKQMLSVVMYSEDWFKLREEYQKLFQKIESKREVK